MIVSNDYVSNNVKKLENTENCCRIEWPDVTAQTFTYHNQIVKWTDKTLPSSQNWSSLAFGKDSSGKSVFVAVANGGTTAAYSYDGINWNTSNALPTLSGGPKWSSVAYGNGVFVAVAWGSARNAAYSYDGINWNISNDFNTYGNWQNITFGNGYFVAVPYGGTRIIYSADGKVWHKAELIDYGENWYSTAYGTPNGKPMFVTIASGTKRIAYSYNGTQWQTKEVFKNIYDLRGIVYANGIFVTAAYNSNYVLWSTDGLNWTESATLPYVNNWYSMTYGNDRFVIIPYQGEQAIYSYDGKEWFGMKMQSSQKYTSVKYGDDKFVVIAGDPSNTTAYGTFVFDGNTHQWAIGSGCDNKSNKINNMCTTVLASGDAICNESECSCKRSYLQTDGVLSENVGKSIIVKTFNDTNDCNTNCAATCAENALNNTDGARGVIICGK